MIIVEGEEVSDSLAEGLVDGAATVLGSSFPRLCRGEVALLRLRIRQIIVSILCRSIAFLLSLDAWSPPQIDNIVVVIAAPRWIRLQRIPTPPLSGRCGGVLGPPSLGLPLPAAPERSFSFRFIVRFPSANRLAQQRCRGPFARQLLL